ncbi:F-box/LRR-repeat protein At5g63520 [Helianthus annuus]|uniref:F-box/LRR-repeat protein At5g63520 n=1 Tax=Helianthus annuus TaxID=4232 RepID=UPI000B9004C4|nr:F-box/LRR-repeat protein At5g63520 [Helianthus annuus]KAJ0756264.1 putative F-box domain, FIST, C-domain, F-box-like domain superfamily protein [Helianthus annuus]
MLTSPTTIDDLSIDLLGNIVSRLHSVDFASADCVSRSWNRACCRVLCRPKLSSACSLSSDLQVAVEGVVNKVLSELIRPHFAIVSVGLCVDLPEARRLITARLSSKIPIVLSDSFGVIGRDVNSDEFVETRWRMWNDPGSGIMLTIGFLPGVKVNLISLSQRIGEDPFEIDKFITDIWEFSASKSGRQSPAAIMIFSRSQQCMNVVEKLDYAMSPETVIVGGGCCSLQYASGSSRNTAALALVFAEDMNKPPGVGETQFHTVLSSALLPVGPTCQVTSIKEITTLKARLTARREGSYENLDVLALLNQVNEELGRWVDTEDFFIGVTRRRECSIGPEKVEWVTSLVFHHVLEGDEESLIVDGSGIKSGDTFRLYCPDPTTAISSTANASAYIRSFKQGSTTGGDKREVFGGYIFSSWRRGMPFFVQPDFDSSPLRDNFPGVTLGGMFSVLEIGRDDSTLYAKESQEQNSAGCCVHECGVVYLIMSYTP